MTGLQARMQRADGLTLRCTGYVVSSMDDVGFSPAIRALVLPYAWHRLKSVLRCGVHHLIGNRAMALSPGVIDGDTAGDSRIK